MLDRKSEDLLRRLIRGGISPRRARRVLLELEEHRADVVAERISLGDAPADAQAAADARLGSDEDWLTQMLARPELQSWVRRHPAATFTVVPLMAFVVTFVASICGWIGLFYALRQKLGPLSVTTPAIRWASEIATVYMLWVTPFITAALISVLAARRRVPPFWPCVGRALASRMLFDARDVALPWVVSLTAAQGG